MPENETLQYLENELSRQIAEFDDSRKFYRSSYFHLTMATAIISGLTTVLIGAGKIVNTDWWFLVPLVFSSFITIASSYESFLRPKELWIQKTDTWMELQNLFFNIRYEKEKIAGAFSQAQIDEFNRRFDHILMNEHRLWMTIRNARTQPNEQGRRRSR